MVRAKQLSVGYGSQVVLRGVTFRFARHQTAVVLGPGGSGKSTLLRTLAGTDGSGARWTRGRLTVDSDRVGTMDQKGGATATLRELLDAARPGVPAATTLRQIWGSGAAGFPQAEALLETCLDARPEELPHGLSRLSMLTAMAASTMDLLLLDEPEAGMTDLHLVWTTALLRSLRRLRTIVLVTHNIALARDVADHALLLIDGAIIESAAHKQFFEATAHPRTRDFLRMGC